MSTWPHPPRPSPFPTLPRRRSGVPTGFIHLPARNASLGVGVATRRLPALRPEARLGGSQDAPHAAPAPARPVRASPLDGQTSEERVPRGELTVQHLLLLHPPAAAARCPFAPLCCQLSPGTLGDPPPEVPPGGLGSRTFPVSVSRKRKKKTRRWRNLSGKRGTPSEHTDCLQRRLAKRTARNAQQRTALRAHTGPHPEGNHLP